MEDLSKTQTVLLCLLVSFVTSIGTGIITVSLLQEAPTSVTQTIHQVVERTVEKVTPQNSTNTVKETVVVKEEDLLVDAIKKNSKSLVRIYQSSNQGGQPSIVALGIVIASKGIILSDKRVIVPDHTYTASFSDGNTLPLNVLGLDDKNDNIYLQALSGPGYTFSPVNIADSDNVQLGQTVIALGGPLKNQVAIGRVTVLDTKDPAPNTSTRPVALITTDSPLKDGLPGTLLINLSGQLVGIKVWQPDTANESQFTPINAVKTGSQQYFDAPKNNNP